MNTYQIPRAAALLLAATLIPGSLLASNGNGSGSGNGGGNGNGNGPPAFVDVVVTYDQMPGSSERARVRGLGSQVKRQYGHFKMLSLRVPETALHGLAQGQGVRSISLDAPVEGLSRAARETARLPEPGSPQYVQALPDVGVAVLDSGVGDHWDLDLRMRVDVVPPYLVTGGVFRDEFNGTSYGGNDGTLSWSGPWLEIGESNGPGTGDVEVESVGENSRCSATRCLVVEADNVVGKGVVRELNLSGAEVATLSYVYGHDDWGGSVALEVSADGGATWTLLRSFSFDTWVSGETDTFDLTQIGRAHV